MDRYLQVLKQQYLQLVEPSTLSFPPSAILHTPSFQSALFNCLFSPDISPAPPPERYTVRVLKRLIAQLSETPGGGLAGHQEEERPDNDPGQEIDERILSLYTRLISQSPPPRAPPAVAKELVTYTLPPSPFSHRPIGQPITLLESRAVISGSGTTGLRTWEAALALAEYLLCCHLSRIYSVASAPPMTAGQTLVVETESVLELGAGTGLVGITAARLGAKMVVATDGDEGVCEALKSALDRNGVGDVVAVKKLLWGEGGEGEEKFDLVVGADVTYDGSVIPQLVAELVEQFERNPLVKVVISATIRNEGTFQVFRESCAKRNLSLSEAVWTTPNPPIFYYTTSAPIHIIRVTRDCPN